MDTQLTVDKHATLFEACDIFIDTDDDGWMFILANPKARAVVSTLIDMAINWDFGTPVQEWWTTAPPDWRAVDLKIRKLDNDGCLSRLPKVGNAETAGISPYSLRLGVAAQSTGLRVILLDQKLGFRKISPQDESLTVDFANARETLTRHRKNGHDLPAADTAVQSSRPSSSSKPIAQNLILPGLPGGPPLVPALPTVSFENGHLSGGRDVLDRIIRTGKAERGVLEFGKPTFPSQIHLFELSPSICNSIGGDDRKQMLGDLATAGLLHLPFEQIALRFYLPDLKPKSSQKVLLTFCASGTLSIHPKDASLVLAEKMGERIEMKSLTGKSQNSHHWRRGR